MPHLFLLDLPVDLISKAETIPNRITLLPTTAKTVKNPPTCKHSIQSLAQRKEYYIVDIFIRTNKT